MIPRPHFESLLGSDGLNSMSFRACFQVTFCIDLGVEVPDSWGPSEQGFREECIAKTVFSQKNVF